VERRRFLKGMAIIGGASAGAPNTISRLITQQTPNGQTQSTAIQAKAIRGLVAKDGALWHPILITFDSTGSDGTVVVQVDGVERIRQTVSSGSHSIEALAVPSDSERKADVTVDISGKVTSLKVLMKPVRKMLVYVLPHSHTDIGYTEIQIAVEQKQIENVRKGIDLARKTANYPEGSRFVWNVEVFWAVSLFMERASQDEQTEFIEAVKKGWIYLNGMFANELTALCRPEELLQLFRDSTRFADRYGIKIDSAMISDVPGYTWGTVTALSQAGMRYFSAAPNYFDRIGTLMQQWQDKPFWWVSPSGKEKVLLWIPWTGYALSHVKRNLSPEVIAEYQERLDSVNFPYGISYLRWSGHGDNAEPDPELPEAVKSWNTKYAWPKFVISSTSTAFAAFEKHHGQQLPEYRGDLTPYWEDGAGSSAFETALNRNTADRLVQAEALFAMRASEAYPAAAFNAAWRNVLLYSEHTWGAWCSVSDSENKLTKDQWEIKRSFALDADKQSRTLLQDALASANEQGAASVIDVHNTSSWPRTELVLIPKQLSKAGDRVTGSAGENVPSQRLATGELAVWATEVAPFGVKRFRLSSGKAHAPDHPVTIQDTTISNTKLRVRVDPQTGGIAELSFLGIDENLVDTASGEQLNEYLFLQGDNLAQLQKNGPVTISVEENGPLVASLRVECPAPGCHSLVRIVRLVAGADHVELINIVDKQRAPLNPNPGKDTDFAQRGAKESVQFAFPFSVSRGTMHLDTPLAVMQPEVNQLPGSCKNWLPVGRWVDVSNENMGVTWVTLDAPLLEVGAISATKLGSQTNTDVWRKEIEPTQKFYSWVMNNHWGTNYRAYQEGVVVFRYAVRPHHGYDPAAATRFATGLSQPLIASAASDGPGTKPHLQVEPSDVLVTTWKVSDDGQAWIVRLFGASGEDRQAKLIGSPSAPMRIFRSDLTERSGTPLTDSVLVPGFGLVTLRIERIRN
jgi:alpha-mannosidase